MDKQIVQQWFKDDGDNTLRINYPLTEDSVVFDVGGYIGGWSQKIADKYNPNLYIFEPIPQFYPQISKRFKDNPKVVPCRFGLLDKRGTKDMSVDNDSSSMYVDKNRSLAVPVEDIASFLEQFKINHIDLIKINIEGAEYPLLQHMIKKGIVEQCQDIQVQFHDFYPDAVKLRDEIREELQKTHYLTYNYPFVWENWRKKR